MKSLFERREKLTSEDAIRTYRYLRIGIVGAVFLLAASIAIERDKVGCWQTSISAYYYTPVRAVFVGTMIAVGLALIVIKGRTPFEDICLNFAGMLAPVVAVAPTTDVGRCWSVAPNPLPIDENGNLANWVVTNINNNFYALLIAGAIGLALAAVIALVVNRGIRSTVERVDRGTLLSLAITAVALAAGWWLIENWSGFSTTAHGWAAILMFVFLNGAVIAKAVSARRKSTKSYVVLYSALALLMPIGAGAIAWFRIGGEHTISVLEGYEIVLFAVFWLIQTWENWDEGHPSSTRALPIGEESSQSAGTP